METNDGELFPVVDQHDQLIGQATRLQCHSDRSLIHRSVHILILDHEGQVFFQKRSMQKDVSPGLWTLSATGHVDLGETYEQAAERELAEELGIHTPLRRIGTWHLDYPREQEFTGVFIGHHPGPFYYPLDEISEGRFYNYKTMLSLHHDKQLTLARPALDLLALVGEQIHA